MKILRETIPVWDQMKALGHNEIGAIPDMMATEEDEGPYRLPHGATDDRFPYLRAGERYIEALPSKAPRLSSYVKVREWLGWTHQPSKRLDAIHEVYRTNKKTGAIAHMARFRDSPPFPESTWPAWRRRNACYWGDGDGPQHYNQTAHYLFALLSERSTDAEREAAWAAFKGQIAQALSTGFDWVRGWGLYEKGHDFPSHNWRRDRVPWSHSFQDALFIAAELEEWNDEAISVKAVRAYQSATERMGPTLSPLYGIRGCGWYLRSLRLSEHFDPGHIPAADLATVAIDALFAELREGKTWVNDYRDGGTVECWQNWLYLAEASWWAARLGRMDWFERIRDVARWEIENTTLVESRRLLVSYLTPWETPGTNVTTAAHTTYAIPVLFALSHAFPGEEWAGLHWRAWEGAMSWVEDNDHDYRGGQYGSGGGSVKQTDRSLYGLLPIYEPAGRS